LVRLPGGAHLAAAGACLNKNAGQVFLVGPGCGFVFRHVSLLAIIAAITVVVGVHLFVFFYEESVLRKKFGPEYEEYCRNVYRWRPRLPGWNKPPSSTFPGTAPGSTGW
jgi:hypothetical protein